MCTIILSWLLFFIRLLNWFVPALQLLPDYILLHVTNFSLSLMVLVALGFAVLIFGGGMKAVTVIGLLIAAFNLGYELVFPIITKKKRINAQMSNCAPIFENVSI